MLWNLDEVYKALDIKKINENFYLMKFLLIAEQ